MHNSNNTIATGAMFGLIADATASATSNLAVPTLINCYSGHPIFHPIVK